MRHIEEILFTEKYRPKTLDDIIIPERYKKRFANGLQTNYLLSGPAGAGKCVCSDTLITIKNKITGKIETVEIVELFRRASTA